MNDTVHTFYDKDSYQEPYDSQHGARLDELVQHCGLKARLAGKRVVDVGGGLGFLGKRLAPSTDYWVIDGAKIEEKDRLCKGRWTSADLDHSSFSSHYSTEVDGSLPRPGEFDAAFCLETLEHLSNPYHCLEQIKRLVKEGGEIYLSVPTETVWHNVVYPSLLWPKGNFDQWLGQMALDIQESWTYVPQGRGWPAYTWRCINRGWEAKRMAFPKTEEKFRLATPLEMTNL